MAGLFDKQASTYQKARPTYPSHWFSMLSALTPDHSLAWDVGTGNGQAAIGVAEHYKQVIATDISEEQLRHAVPRPNIRYVHTPQLLSDEELIAMIGGENSVDLITAAAAVHWLDLPKFYSLANRLLKKPGGIIAVWTYGQIQVSSEFEELMKPLIYEKVLNFQDPISLHGFNCYKTLPFPFESVGLGCEGQPHELDMFQDVSFERFMGLLKSLTALNTAKQQGVDLLNESVVKEIEKAWGGHDLIRTVNFKTFMLVGKVKLDLLLPMISIRM